MQNPLPVDSTISSSFAAGKARIHERWRRRCRDELEQLKTLARQQQRNGIRVRITRHLLMLLTLEPRLLESLRQIWNNIPSGSLRLRKLCLDFSPVTTDHGCRNPPTDDALLATASELAHMVNSIDPVKHLDLDHVPFSIASLVLTICSRLQSLRLMSYPLVLSPANVRSMFSCGTLEQLEMRCLGL